MLGINFAQKRLYFRAEVIVDDDNVLNYRMATDLQNKTVQRWLHLHFRPKRSRKCVDFASGSGSGPEPEPEQSLQSQSLWGLDLGLDPVTSALARLLIFCWHSVLIAAHRIDGLLCFMRQMKGKGLANTLISNTWIFLDLAVFMVKSRLIARGVRLELSPLCPVRAS